jgi:hypothetical protein
LSAVNAHGETALDVAKASGHSETAAFLATAALIQGIDKGESRVGAAAFQEWAAAERSSGEAHCGVERCPP